MAATDTVRSTRDGDQFHYHWAARFCLELLPGASDLVAVTIEGPAKVEGDEVIAGEELIDVGLYYGSMTRTSASRIRYVQLKHSTLNAAEEWTASGLKKTIAGFGKRYADLIKEFDAEILAKRFRFEFISNRPISGDVNQALSELAKGINSGSVNAYLGSQTGLTSEQNSAFFKLFSANGCTDDLWVQRNLLAQDVRAYLPDADYDAPGQLKELVARKATSEFAANPSIVKNDVLRVLKVSEDDLLPAPCLIAFNPAFQAREQEDEILKMLGSADTPLILHAEGGVGKSVIAARLAARLPTGSAAVLYDCFGDGLYRNALHYRHRHRDGLVQIANELSARGLCHPLIPSFHADTKKYLRAFVHRLTQAIDSLRVATPDARLYLFIDAADNAQMIADELNEPNSFVRDLIRTTLPSHVKVIFTCRTHRIQFLAPPPGTPELELRSFTDTETARHLRTAYQDASDADVTEFQVLSSSNPRVQALALSKSLPLADMLQSLGPNPTTVERAIGELLESAIQKLKDGAGTVESTQIEFICEALAILRPLVPISILSQISGVPEAGIRSFALDFGRPLFVKGDSLHFLDEPAETWFRERFKPRSEGMAKFLARLRPLAATSSYAAAALPLLLLQAGNLDELVTLALSDEGLPTDNPLVKRDVEVQRLTFALKACLQKSLYLPAAKLALKAAGESAGEARQTTLIQENTHLAARLMSADRIEEIVSRRTFQSTWMGSHHAYDAALLSDRAALYADASSHLRMAMDWLRSWAKLSSEEREQDGVSDDDRAALTMSLLRLRSGKAAAGFLRKWTHRPLSMHAGRNITRSLIDLGEYQLVDELFHSAGNDIWLKLGICREAQNAGHPLPAADLDRLLRLLNNKRVQLEESKEWNANWEVLYAVTAAVELALKVLPHRVSEWTQIIARYLPSKPPSELTTRFGFDSGPLLNAYVLRAALSGQRLNVEEIAPAEITKELENRSQHRSQEASIFLYEVGSRLPLLILSAEIKCGRAPGEIPDAIDSALKNALSQRSHYIHEGSGAVQSIALQYLAILRQTGRLAGDPGHAFLTWFNSRTDPIWPDTLISLCRSSARHPEGGDLAMEFGARAFEVLDKSREEAETRTTSFVKLATAILPVSRSEAAAYFDRAIEIASRIGEENSSRWGALLHLTKAAAHSNAPREKTAYRVSRAAELTYEYVYRDKHFDWERTVTALSELCPRSTLAILSRWRDRRFGDADRLFPDVLYDLNARGLISELAPTLLAGLDARWERVPDLSKILKSDLPVDQRRQAAQISYRYIRVDPQSLETLLKVQKLGQEHAIEFRDIDRLVALGHFNKSQEKVSPKSEPGFVREVRMPDWDVLFSAIDFSDAAKLGQIYASLKTYDPPYQIQEFFKEGVARAKSAKVAEFIVAVSAWPDFDKYHLYYLLDAFPTWPPRQLAVKKAIREAVLSVSEREPAGIQRTGWGRLIKFEKLVAAGILTDDELVQAMLKGFSIQADILGAGGLFQMIDPLAFSLTPAEADEALNFGLDLLEEVLTPQDGDGPWTEALMPPKDVLSSLAGYLWAGLGSPVTAERWRFAHVIRSIVEVGWGELLEKVLALALLETPTAFTDAGLVFYRLHALQWLTIGLARGSKENPEALKPHVTWLRARLTEGHLLIAIFAEQTLRHLVPSGAFSTDTLEEIDPILKRHKPETVGRSYDIEVEQEDENNGEDQTTDEKYYFGIDIGPYWFAPLGRAFGLSEGRIEKMARAKIKAHLGGHTGNFKDDVRHTRKIFGDSETYHSHSSSPKTDDLRFYNSYHALMYVASDLLKLFPVLREEESQTDEFDEWLKSFQLTRDDGHWLFDGRDPEWLGNLPTVDYSERSQWRWGVNAAYLDARLTADDGSRVLWGYWNQGTGDQKENVAIRTALVTNQNSSALLAALQTAPNFDRLVLPEARSDSDYSVGSFRLHGLVGDQGEILGIDENDPWAAGVPFPGPHLRTSIAAALGGFAPTEKDNIYANALTGLRTETWGTIHHSGREEETISGSRLCASARAISALLHANPDSSLICSVRVNRPASSYERSHGEYEPYPWSYTRYYLLGSDNVISPL